LSIRYLKESRVPLMRITGNPTFSVVIHSTSITQDYASFYSQLLEQPFNGNYRRLNGLVVGDDFGRKSRKRDGSRHNRLGRNK
jgi:hypothetical protein